MGFHSEIEHVFESTDEREVTYGGRTFLMSVKGCGCGTKWFRTSEGDEWQESREGLRTPAPPMWKIMEAERAQAKTHEGHFAVARAQQAHLRQNPAALRQALAEYRRAPLPEIATVNPYAGYRDPADLGVWDDDWWHYEVVDGEILVYHLDRKRRGAPVWRFPLADVPYAPTA